MYFGYILEEAQFGPGSITIPEFKQAKFLGITMYFKMKIGAKGTLNLVGLVWFFVYGLVE